MKDHVALLIREENKFLFVKRSRKKKTLPNIWAFPSGTREEFEKIEDTARREASEELGVEIDPEKIIAIKELPEFNVKLHFLVSTIRSGTPIIKERNEIEELAWFEFEEFFSKYPDEQIGHGLIFLRQNPEIWKGYGLNKI